MCFVVAAALVGAAVCGGVEVVASAGMASCASVPSASRQGGQPGQHRWVQGLLLASGSVSQTVLEPA